MPDKANTKSINNYLTSSKIKLSINDRSFIGEKSFYLENNRATNNKSKDKQSNIKQYTFLNTNIADKYSNTKSQDKYKPREISSNKPNFKSNQIFPENAMKSNYFTESGEKKNYIKSRNVESTNSSKLVPSRTQFITKEASMYKNHPYEIRKQSSDKNSNFYHQNVLDRHTNNYLDEDYSEFSKPDNTNYYYKVNKLTFKPKEEELKYEQKRDYNYYKKTKSNEDEKVMNMSSSNHFKDKQDFQNHIKKYYLHSNNNNSDYLRNHDDNSNFFMETFGKNSNIAMNIKNSQMNKIETKLDNKIIKDNFQKFLVNKNPINKKRSNVNDNSFISYNSNLDFRNSNESRINTENSNTNKKTEKEMKSPYDDKMFSDLNNLLKQNKETGDSYKFKITNTHSSGNASSNFEDYRNIKFENVEETHFINLYILQSSKNMLKIQEQIYDEKNLFKTVTQLEEEIDL